MSNCVNCGKPRTNDSLCPRCGGDWEQLSSSRDVVRSVLNAAINYRVSGEGVVRRNGKVIYQQEQPE